MPNETASLVLKSGDLTFGSTTNIGTANQYGTVLTWNNINLRVVLGDMYDKYDRFNLNLNTIATGVAGNYGGTADERSNYVLISGLPWTNNTYNQSTNSNTNSTVIASIYIQPNAQTTQYFYGNNTSTFSKNQDVCNITISFLRINDGLAPNVTIAYPKIIFIFDIEGIDEYRVNDITKARAIN